MLFVTYCAILCGPSWSLWFKESLGRQRDTAGNFIRVTNESSKSYK